MSEVLQTVLDYVKSPQTDYALLITGSWGCGKTYFWKNVIVPELKHLQDSNHIKCILYASFYGVTDVKDIDRSLFAQSYPGINRKGVGRTSRVIAGVVEALGYVDLAKINLRSLIKAKDAVICFDDLERSRLTIEETLGYINSFVEHEEAKVIILCNEDEINEEDIKIYRKIKEKVVGSCLSFQPEIDTVLDTLIGEYKTYKEFHDFVMQNTGLIRQLFINSDTNNLRSLCRAMAALFVIFNVLYKEGIDIVKLKEQLIYAVAPTAFELYGRGADPEKLKAIHAMDYISLAGISVLRRTLDQSGKKDYEEEFNERYFGAFNLLNLRKAVGCPPICEFMITGFLDRASLLEWGSKLTQPPDKKEQCIKQLLFDPREMNDKDFTELASQVLDYVESGEISEISTYVSLYDRFEWFVEESLISETQNQIIEKFKKGLEKAQEAKKLNSNPDLEFDIERLIRKPMSTQCQALCDYIIGMNERLLGSDKNDLIKELLSSFEDEPKAFIDSLVDSGESGFFLTPVFQELDIDTTAKQILSLPNVLKKHFGIVMHERYLKHQPHSEYVIELPVLIGIRNVIKDYYETSSIGLQIKTMSLLLTRAILKILDQIIEQLEQIKQKKNGNKQ